MEDLDLYDWVPVFSGDQSLFLDVYFQKVHSYCVFHDLSPRKELLLAEHRCVGAAAFALTGKSFNSLTELRSLLEDAFDPSQEDAFTAFCQVKQGTCEPVTAYADRLRQAFERTPVSGAAYLLRRFFVQGLQPTLQQQVLQLAPDSFGVALAKAKVFEADTYQAASLVSSGWPGPSQEPSVPRSRQGRAHKQAQRTAPTQVRSLPPSAQTAEPERSCHAADFSTELLNTTELLQDLLQSCEASQGSPVVGDPTAACQLFQLVDPPATAARPLSILEAVASPLRSFLDRALHHGDLPPAVLHQLEHCQTQLQGLESILARSESPLSDAPLPQAPIKPDYAEQHLSEQALTARDTSIPPSVSESSEPAQPLPEPCRPSSFAVDPSSEAEAEAPTTEDPELSHQVKQQLSEDYIHADLPSAAVASETIAPCVVEAPTSNISLPGEASLVQHLGIQPLASDHSPPISHAQAQPEASHEHCCNSGMSLLPGAAAKHLPTTSTSPHMLCEHPVPACLTSDPNPAIPITLIKAGRGPKMRPELDTAASVMIAGFSHEDTPGPSVLVTASAMADRPDHISSNLIHIVDPQQPSTATTVHQDSCPTLDPRGLWMLHDFTPKGDLVTTECPASLAHTLIPGTDIVLVLGRRDDYIINCFDSLHLPFAAFHGLVSSASIVWVPHLRFILPVSALVHLSALPSFTEPPDPG